MNVNRTPRKLILALTSAIGLPLAATQAADQTWGGTGSTTTTADYSTATNWSAGTIPTGGSQTDRAIFNGVNGAAATAITVNANRTGRFLFTGSTSYTLSGGSFTASGGADMVNLDASNAADQTVNSDMYFGAAAGGINILRNSSTGNRTLNLGGAIGGQLAASGIANALQVNSGTGNTIVMSGLISDTLAGRTNNGGVFNIQKIGGGSQSGGLTLNGNNTYTGGTDYFAGSGSFTLGHKNALGTGDLRVNGGGVTINANTTLTGANAIANTLRFNGTLTSVSGTTDVTGITLGSNAATVSNATGLAVGQILNYQGVMRNFAIGTYITSISGTNITLSTNALSTANISSGTARFQSYGSGSGTTLFDGTNALEFSGTTYIGSERATSGTATQTFNVTNSAGVTFSGTLTEQNSIIDGLLVQGAITKTGAGTLALSGNNTYSGATNVNAGTLLITNTSGSATGTGAINVTVSGKLGGKGFIAPTGANGLSFASGTGVDLSSLATFDTLTLDLTATTGSSTFSLGSTFKFDLTAANVSDTLAITGLDGASIAAFNSNSVTVNGGVNGLFTLFTFAGGANQADNYSGTLNSTVLGLDGGQTASFIYNANSIQLNVVPEPSSFGMLLGGLGTLVAFQRRRRA